MAVYKVPQDVEADDKFLGPLSFKQFLFGGGALISGYLIFVFLTKGIWPLVIILLPIFLAFAALAFPWSKDQPTELWLASRIRFMLVPHRRIWDQSGIKDLVQITVPKREVHMYSDGLTQDEVRSRLSALASVVDTRGWAVKNATGSVKEDLSDRLVQNDLPAPTEDDAILANATDVMDEQQNPIAQQFESMIRVSEDRHREDALAKIQEARETSSSDADEQTTVGRPASPKVKKKDKHQSEDFWFMHDQPTPPDPSYATFKSNAVVKPGEKNAPMGMGVPVATIKQEDEQKLLKKVHKQQKQDAMLRKQSHLKTVMPLSEQPTAASPAPAQDTSQPQTQNASAFGTTPVDPAIMMLASNDDLNVETIARQAKKDLSGNDEVVIKLR